MCHKICKYLQIVLVELVEKECNCGIKFSPDMCTWRRVGMV